ncbi:MAG: hypothetical protein EXS58_12970 [Candidatus Latescibacteria bacterium]|nr:hypothetical protein [Candidatus Latescibacterota bacterium]
MELEQRVTALEGQIKYLRFLAAALGAGLVALLSLGATGSQNAVQDFQVVRTRDLLIVNDQGQVMCSVGEDGEGNGRLALNSRSDKQIFIAGADERGNGQLLISSNTDQGVFSAVVDADGNGRLLIGSKGQRPLVSAGSDKKGNGQFLLFSGGERTVLSAGVDATGNGGIVDLFNRAGQGVVQLSCDEQGSGMVGAYDGKGAGRALKAKP